MWELWGVEISAFPFTWHIAYTTTCCYRTSRDTVAVAGDGRGADGSVDESIVVIALSASGDCVSA